MVESLNVSTKRPPAHGPVHMYVPACLLIASSTLLSSSMKLSILYIIIWYYFEYNLFFCFFVLFCIDGLFPFAYSVYFGFYLLNFSVNTQIRVVNAFRQGLDARYGEHTNTSLAEVLRKQTSLSKRLSQTSSIEYADNIPDELTIPEIDVERLSSHSHTETAV